SARRSTRRPASSLFLSPIHTLAGPSAVSWGSVTVSVAVLLVVPVRPFVELTAPVVLSFPPAEVAVTSTEIAHEPPASTVPPLRLIVPLPAVAPLSVPLHVLLELGVLATFTPDGKVSLTATPVSAVPPFGLLMVKVSVEVPPTLMLVGENALLTVGGLVTVSVAVLLAWPGPPFVELTAPVVLFLPPPDVAGAPIGTAHQPPAAEPPPRQRPWRP